MTAEERPTWHHVKTSGLYVVLSRVIVKDRAGVCAPHTQVFEKKETQFYWMFLFETHLVHVYDLYMSCFSIFIGSVFSVYRTQYVSADQWWSPDRAPLHVSSPSPPHVSGCRGSWCHWSPGCSSSRAQWWGLRWWGWSCPCSSQSPGGIWPEKTNRQQNMRQLRF